MGYASGVKIRAFYSMQGTDSNHFLVPDVVSDNDGIIICAKMLISFSSDWLIGSEKWFYDWFINISKNIWHIGLKNYQR